MILTTKNFNIKKVSPLQAYKHVPNANKWIFNIRTETLFLVWADQTKIEKNLLNSPIENKYIVKVIGLFLGKRIKISIIDVQTKRELPQSAPDSLEILNELSLHGFNTKNELSELDMKQIMEVLGRPVP